MQNTSGPFPVSRFESTAEVFNGQMIVFGGKACGSQATTDSDIYVLDLSTWVWIKHATAGADVPSRFGHSSSVLVSPDGSFGMYIYGGAMDTKGTTDVTYSEDIDDRLFRLDLVGDSWVWSQVHPTGVPPGKKIGSCGLAFSNTTMLLFGDQEASYLPPTYMYVYQKLSCPRSLFCAATLPNEGEKASLPSM